MSKTATKTAKPPRPAYRCEECGWETAKWVGRCGECQAWGTVIEAASPRSRIAAGPVSTPAVPVNQVPAEESLARTCGIGELDRVLGGGLVPGGAILLAGEPGVGKSTLLLEVAAQTARLGHRTLYLTGEESASQVRLRADRTGNVEPELFLAAESDLGAVLTHIEQVRPTLVVIDSIQTMSAADVEGVPGGVTQIKEVSASLIRAAKLRNITLVLIGHVTKDGSIAGPRVLEHLVDVVLHFEGERTSRLRMLRAVKNRFGPVDEIGCFDLSAEGIVEITDPTGLFFDVRDVPVPGTCVAVAMEGRRPLLSEVQALLSHSGERPRRTTSGVDGSRVAMILAILEQHAGLPLQQRDVFVSSVGGARLNEPAHDLAIALALVSAAMNRPLGRNVVAIGELSLAGEVRRVRDTPARLAEAARMGFKSAVVPVESAGGSASAPRTVRDVDGMRVLDLGNIAEALTVLGMRDPT